MDILNVISKKSKLGNRVHIGRFCIIDDGVEIGDDVHIGDYSLISKGSKIGSHAMIGTYSKIGRNVVIGQYCSFTSYCEIRDNCVIGNGVSMGSRCTLSAGTIVENNVIIKYSFVAADTPDMADSSIKKVVRLREGSQFGANVTIMPGITIGKNSIVGACSLIRESVKDNEVWFGSPGRFYKFNK